MVYNFRNSNIYKLYNTIISSVTLYDRLKTILKKKISTCNLKRKRYQCQYCSLKNSMILLIDNINILEVKFKYSYYVSVI